MAVVLATAVAAAAGCKRDEPVTTVDEVVEETPEYIGKQVTVTGEVDQIHNDRAFVLEAGGLAPDRVLVITKVPIRLSGTSTLDQGNHVWVTGVVHTFEVNAIEREVGWDLEPQIETEHTGKAVIMAEAIGLLREEGVWREEGGYVGTAGMPGGTQPDEQQQFQGGVEVIAVIVAAVQPEDLVGRQVTLENVQVRQVAGDKTFWIGESPTRQILVYLEEEGKERKMDVKAGQQVTIRGTLQKMPEASAVVEQWGVSPGMKGMIENQALYLRAESVEKS